MATSTIQAINGIVDITNQVSLSMDASSAVSGTVTLREAKKLGNVLYMVFTVTPSSTAAAGANADVKFTGVTPAVADETIIGSGIRGRTLWSCWLKLLTGRNVMRCRKVSDDTWAADTPVTLNTQFPVY